jgi:hypothetical protein
MQALVRPQVDALDGDADRAQQTLDEPVAESGECDHGAVMVWIRIGVEHVRGRGAGNDRRYDGLVAPF